MPCLTLCNLHTLQFRLRTQARRHWTMYKLLVFVTLLAMIGALISSGISMFGDQSHQEKDPKRTARRLGWRVGLAALLLIEVAVGVLTGQLAN